MAAYRMIHTFPLSERFHLPMAGSGVGTGGAAVVVVAGVVIGAVVVVVAGVVFGAGVVLVVGVVLVSGAAVLVDVPSVVVVDVEVAAVVVVDFAVVLCSKSSSGVGNGLTPGVKVPFFAPPACGVSAETASDEILKALIDQIIIIPKRSRK